MFCLVLGQEQVRGEQHGGLRDYGLPNHNTLSSYHQQNLNVWIAKNILIRILIDKFGMANSINTYLNQYKFNLKMKCSYLMRNRDVNV